MNENILKSIFRTIRDYHMIEPGMRVIAGVSGGADSVCLLLALAKFREQTPFELSVVHVEHGLRGRESLEDAEFTEKLCEELGLCCRVVHADVRGYAKTNGLSCEEAARICRYRIFEELRQEWGADRVAVAHHEEDQAETILWNLIRGSGLRGLCGIRPVRGALIRPLLLTTRAEIEEFLTSAGQTWRTDRTNLEQNCTRNRLRLSVLPEMEQTLNAQAVRHIAQAGERLRQAEEYIEKNARVAAERCLCRQNGEVCLLLAPYQKEEPLIRQELLKLALQQCMRQKKGRSEDYDSEYGMKDVSAVHLTMLERLAGQDCGKSCDLPGKIRAVREDGLIRFRRDCGGTVIAHEDAEGSAIGGTISIPGSYVFRGRPYGWPDVSAAETACGEPETTGAEPSACKGQGSSTSGTACGEPETTEPESSICKALRGGTSEAAACAGTEASEPESSVCAVRVTAEVFQNSPELRSRILEEKRYTKWFPCDTIGKNVQIRTRRPGDYLIINAGGGKKKLKDYMIDCKIPREKRDQVWLLADGSHVLWVIGWRISEAVKVSPDIRSVVRICIGKI